jgi:hypothetical protein
MQRRHINLIKVDYLMMTNLLNNAENLYARDKLRRELRDTILEQYKKLKQENNVEKNYGRSVSRNPVP